MNVYSIRQDIIFNLSLTGLWNIFQVCNQWPLTGGTRHLHTNPPWKLGYSIKKWRFGTDVVIHKNPDEHNSDNLHPLLLWYLYENYSKYVIWRYLMKILKILVVYQREIRYQEKYSVDVQALKLSVFFYMLKMLQVLATYTITYLKYYYDIIVHIIKIFHVLRQESTDTPMVCMIKKF